MCKVSIVIPAYNEAEAIEGVIKDIIGTMRGADLKYEIIVVDDGSDDRTAQIVRTIEGVKLLQHPYNKGVGTARMTGIKGAAGDIIVMIDGDGSYSSKDIPVLLDYMGQYDMVIGARKAEAGTLRLLRKPTKWVLRRLAEYISREKIPDLNSGLRAFKKEIALRYFNILPEGHSWISTITIAFLSDNCDVKYVPIDYYRRKGRSTFRPIADTTAYFLLIFRTIMYFKPLRIFAPVAVAIFILGVIRTIYDATILHDIKESDVIIVLASILIGVLGLLADLIVKKSR